MKEQTQLEILREISETLTEIKNILSQTDDKQRGEQSAYFHNLRDDVAIHMREYFEIGEIFDAKAFIHFAYCDSKQVVSLTTCKRWLDELVAIGTITECEKNSYCFA